MSEKDIQKLHKVINKRIDGIEKSLDMIEDLMWWTILAEQRGFKVGQRVKLTDRAIRKGIRPKGGVRKGTIAKIGDTFSIDVLVDGYAKPRGYHHSYWEEVWRP